MAPEACSPGGPRTFHFSLSRLDPNEARTARETWTVTAASRFLGAALSEEPVFWELVADVRAARLDFGAVAARFVPYHGRRRVLVGHFVRTAVARRPHRPGSEAPARTALLNVGTRAWWPEAPVAERGAARAPGQSRVYVDLREDRAATFARAAVAVARRGARRCAEPACGRSLSASNPNRICSPCAASAQHGYAALLSKAETALFAALGEALPEGSMHLR